MNADRQRLALTFVWFAGMLVSTGVALSYMSSTNSNGVPLLLWTDVTLVLKSVFAIYATYLGGIIIFWFAKPFKVQRGSSRDQIRFWIALVGALVVNAAYASGLSIGYWNSGARLDDIIDARSLVLWLSFIVAPANLYFFGIRRDAAC